MLIPIFQWPERCTLIFTLILQCISWQRKNSLFHLTSSLVDQQAVAGIGYCHPFTFLEGYLNEPLVLTKDSNGALHCLSNVCTHRGTIVVHEPCKVSQLRCRYHGRSFALDGKFKSHA